jgi:membrane-bound serine protease (ClpP class)
MESGIMTTALTTVLIALLGSVALFFIVLRYLPDARFASGLMLRTSLAGAEAPSAQAPGARGPLQGLLGRTGVAVTDLRPSGKVRLGDTIHDVVGQMAWIDRGSPVRVVDVDGVRVMVARVDDDGTDGAADGTPPEAPASVTREG